MVAAASAKKATGFAAKKRPKLTKKQRNIRSATNAYQRVQKSRVAAEKDIQATREASAERVIRSKTAASERIAAARAEGYVSSRVASQKLYADIARRKAIKKGVARAGSRAASGVSGVGNTSSVRSAVGTIASPASSAVNPLLLVLFTWAGIVILYAMITTPEHTSKFMTSLKSWVSLLYSTNPMFTVKETQSE